MKTYVKDDWDFIRKLSSHVDYPCVLASCDVVSLYTSIPHDLGLEALSYWIDKKRNLIPERFTKAFILEAASFVLSNNNFQFDIYMFLQLVGTAMGTKFAPPYACLSVGYLEETILFPRLLPLHFTLTECKLIEEIFKRFMDYGFVLWPKNANIDIFRKLLNELHPSLKFTVEKGKNSCEQNFDTFTQVLNFLDVSIILHQNGRLETDIFYKETNSHDYLNYFSHHPQHTKQNIPYNLAKRIIVFVSDEEKMNERLSELKTWLLSCNYPLAIIDKAFFNARLQGPAPKKEEIVIPFVSTHYSNFDSKSISITANSLLSNVKDKKLKKVFDKCKVIHALKQPTNLLRLLSQPKVQNCISKKNGLYRYECKDFRCNLCASYIQECSSFITSNGYNWKIRCHINCHSRNVLYFLSCNSCNGFTTYTGKTVNFRHRMNNHITVCRYGTSTDKFDNHVFKCINKNDHVAKEPYFKVYAFMTVNNENKLLCYESYLHKMGFDTMNC